MRRFVKIGARASAMLALFAWVVAAVAQPISPVFTTVTASNLIQAPASVTGHAGFNMPPGAAPTAPNPGDVWITSSGMYAYIGGVTVGPFGSGGSANSGSANQIGYYASTGTTLSGLATANNSVLITGSSGVPSISSTLPSGLTIPSFVGTVINVANSGALPTVTAGNSGQMAFVSNCLNGTQTGINGTGCLYVVNSAGTWAPVPTIPTQTITVGGQALNLGSTANSQGNGSAIATANGTFTNGDCVSINAGGAIIDAGGPCTTGGGGGTVASGSANGVAYYTGTTTTGSMSVVNNGVVITSSSGVPSESTTLPASLTIPSPTLSNAALTGTGTYATLNGSGKLTTMGSTASTAGLNLPAGTAPTSPVNGDMWTTTTGLFARINGSTIGPFGSSSGTVSSIATTSPISGGTITTSGTITCPTCATTTNGGLLSGTSPVAINAAGAISCATCVTTTGGGALTATSPVAVSSAGLITCSTCLVSSAGGTLVATSPLSITGSTISLASQTGAAAFNWDGNTNVTNQTYYLAVKWPWTSGSIASVSYLTGGSATPSFVIAVQINGSNVTTCNGITVSSSSVTTTNCGTNTIASGNAVTLVISSSSGTPNTALVQVNYSRSAI